jgi:hypothetical protein
LEVQLSTDVDRPRAIRDDVERVVDLRSRPKHDLYLFLRSLKIADTIRFDDENGENPRSFEVVLSKAIDSPGKRLVACVGSGGERRGAAQIHFDANWKQKIVPLFKSAVVIISMPSVTPACLEESELIRGTPELLAKTLFVLPPLECYQRPDKPKRWALDEDFEEFQKRMVRVHRDEIGLHFPEPERNAGLFLVMDFKTGSVIDQRPWKIVNLTTTYMSGSPPTLKRFPSLDERDIRAAVRLVLQRRGVSR